MQRSASQAALLGSSWLLFFILKHATVSAAVLWGQRRFRVVRAHHFLQAFASDRRHMWVDAPTMSGKRGAWVAPPPAWPLIVAPGERTRLVVRASAACCSACPVSQPVYAADGRVDTLPLFLDMALRDVPSAGAPELGCVLGEEEFVRRFSRARVQAAA